MASIVTLGERDVTLRMPFRKEITRAGGTISGPALMMLADTAAYFLALAHGGPVSAATANLAIHVLARPEPADVLAPARLLRMGRRLAVSTVEMSSEPTGAVVAHATVTYALPEAKP